MVLRPTAQTLTSNQALLDLMIGHQIGLQRVTASIQKEIIAILDATEADIAAQVRQFMGPHSRKGPTARSIKRSLALGERLAAIRGEAWTKADQVWLTSLLEVIKREPIFTAQAMQTTAPVVLQTELPAAETLRSIVKTRPFEGKVLSTWQKQLRQTDINRMTDEIRIGIVQGETQNQMARRIVGTARLRGSDGVTEITRRAALAITRTSVNAFTNEARRELFRQNQDIIKEELYVATLDNRTTNICASLDGEKFPVAEGPYPPLHINCRSLRVAAFDGDFLGSRPFKVSTASQLNKEFREGKGIVTKGQTRAGLPRKLRGEFDDFSRRRVRELTGTTPQTTTYQQWLGRQSAAFQNDVLGPTRGKLFRSGNLELKKFVNRNGGDIPLRQLAQQEEAAFISAGLDPDSF